MWLVAVGHDIFFRFCVHCSVYLLKELWLCSWKNVLPHNNFYYTNCTLVTVVTRRRRGRSGVQYQSATKGFVFSKMSRLNLKPTHPRTECEPGAFSVGVKGPPCGTEVKNW